MPPIIQSKIRIAIIDLELTCDDQRPFDIEEHEIIEIGICVCNLSSDELEIIDSKQFFVKPIMNPQVTKFCTHLTGIHQATVDQAQTLAEVLPLLNDWLIVNEVAIWGSWGNDRKMFIIECQLKKLENPMTKFQHLDIKRIFSQVFGWRVGMTRALSLRGIEPEGNLHSGIDDAKNVAKLIKYEKQLREEICSLIEDSHTT